MPLPPPAESALTPTATGSINLRDSVPTREFGSWVQRLRGFLGPGYLVAVGYMDPGNWATDIAGGSQFGYTLLWIVLTSNVMAMLLQVLASRLGIVTGLNLAQACRLHYSRRSVLIQWILCEIAICATDLAEVIGTAIALNLLFDLPLTWGVLLTASDVLVVLWLQRYGFRYLEAVVIALLILIFACIGFNLFLSNPEWSKVAAGFLPGRATVANPEALYVTIGIIGATVMPHNLYLHSEAVQTRKIGAASSSRRAALGYSAFDVIVALAFAFVVNAAILATAASAFHAGSHSSVTEIQDAFHLLGPALGASFAAPVFALALLASGQSSTLTATLAGQIVMDGYLELRFAPWLRRLITRLIAIMPALVVTLLYGASGTNRLLVLSQVILSLQLPFAVVPLIRFTSNATLMGEFVNSTWLKLFAWLIALSIISMNIALVTTSVIAYM